VVAVVSGGVVQLGVPVTRQGLKLQGIVVTVVAVVVAVNLLLQLLVFTLLNFSLDAPNYKGWG